MDVYPLVENMVPLQPCGEGAAVGFGGKYPATSAGRSRRSFPADSLHATEATAYCDVGADGVRLHTLYRHRALFASSLRPIGGAHGTRQACHYVRECLSPQKAEARMISASEPITCAERCSRRYHKTRNAVARPYPSATGVTTFADSRQTTVGQHSIVAKRYTNDESGITSSQTSFFVGVCPGTERGSGIA